MNDAFFSRLNLLDGFEFENLISRLLKEMGLGVTQTRKTGDGGVDIIAQSKEPITGGVYVIQCKRQKSKVSEPTLRDLYGTVFHNNASKGILITTSSFTSQARAFASGKPLELIDQERLRELLIRYRLHDSSDSEANVYVLPAPPQPFWLNLLEIISKIEDMLEMDSVSTFRGGRQCSLKGLIGLIDETLRCVGNAGIEIAKICIDVSDRFKTISVGEVRVRKEAVGEHFSQIIRSHNKIRKANVNDSYLTLKQTGMNMGNSFLRQLMDFLRLNASFLDYDGKEFSGTVEITGSFVPNIDKETKALQKETKRATRHEIRTKNKGRIKNKYKDASYVILGWISLFVIYILS